MEIYHDVDEPFDFIISNDNNYYNDPYDNNYYNDTYDIVDPVGFGFGHAIYTEGNPEFQLLQYRDFTHDIYNYWNGFDETGKEAVLNNFSDFHPLDDIYYDSIGSWQDVNKYWYIPDSYFDYNNNNRYWNNKGWRRGYALLAYMKAIADKHLKKHFKSACDSRDKAIARAIWNTNSAKFPMPPPPAVPFAAAVALTIPELAAIQTNLTGLGKYTATNVDIETIFQLMYKCHIERTNKITNANIEKFLKKVCKDGIANAAANFKKYLLFKKKYLDKKTLKKL